jgi:DNA-binding GntR family transcriptional regulator
LARQGIGHSGLRIPPHATIGSVSAGPTLTELAYQAILSAICDGSLPSGTRIHHDELASRMGISRQPVGQALSILRTQGFLRDNGRRGLHVAPLEREFFYSIYEIRRPLDALAARLSAQRCNAQDIAEGRRLIAEGRTAAQTGSVPELIAADMRFHMWIYRVSRNPILTETMGLYWNHLRRAMAEVLKYPARRRSIWDEHAGILQAISDRDASGASQRTQAHVKDAAERFGKLIAAAPQAQ